MPDRDLAIGLMWAGLILLAFVLVLRMRRGAWDEEAFDDPLPVGRWNWLALGSALSLSAAGTVLLFKTLL